MSLKTDYKDYIFDTMKNTTRKFNMINNPDGTVSFEDVSEYSQTGDSFGANDINNITKAIGANTKSISQQSEANVNLEKRVTILENNGIGGGTTRWSDNAINLIITILKQGGYKTDQTANIDALEAELLSTSDEGTTATLSSISAVFSQGSNIIYTTDNISTLKNYLVVTANYSDGTTKKVTSYGLSGELTEGTSVITVSYGGKTTTFSCTVAKKNEDTETEDVMPISNGVLTIEATSNASISNEVLIVA